jgi:hypothetical protein
MANKLPQVPVRTVIKNDGPAGVLNLGGSDYSSSALAKTLRTRPRAPKLCRNLMFDEYSQQIRLVSKTDFR